MWQVVKIPAGASQGVMDAAIIPQTRRMNCD